MLAQSRPSAPGVQSGQGQREVPLGPRPGTHLQQDAISVPLNLRGRICLHRALQNQLPRGQANHGAGASGPDNVWRCWGRAEKA